jgi:hypothetical protein
MTADTKDAPLAARATTPARDRVREAIVAPQAKPKNFSHIIARIFSETWTTFLDSVDLRTEFTAILELDD